MTLDQRLWTPDQSLVTPDQSLVTLDQSLSTLDQIPAASRGKTSMLPWISSHSQPSATRRLFPPTHDQSITARGDEMSSLPRITSILSRQGETRHPT